MRKPYDLRERISYKKVLPGAIAIAFICPDMTYEVVINLTFIIRLHNKYKQ